MSLLQRMNPGKPAEATKPASADEEANEPRGQLRADLLADKAAIHKRLVERHASALDVGNRDEVRRKVVELSEAHVRAAGLAIGQRDLDLLVESVLDDVLGLGPLEALLEDPEITEIMINHPRQVYVERRGRLSASEVVFESDRQLRQVIDRIVSSVGRRVDESSPMVDARLADGSRVNVVLPPLALKGACMSIRKFTQEKLSGRDLEKKKSGSAAMLRFLEGSVRARLNVVIAGGTSSGKTTLLNIVSSFIPASDRIITIEDAAELSLQQAHVITLESRPPNVEGAGAVPIRELVRNSLRMRPDRIIVGECRGGEALDMLQAMNTGHDGSLTTLHANTPKDAMTRLETMVLMAGADLPAQAIQKQMASAIDLLVQAQRVRGGARRIVSITEVLGLVDGEIALQEIFTYRQLGVTPAGNAFGYHTATGAVPVHLDQLRSSGEDLPESLFEPTPQPPPGELY